MLIWRWRKRVFSPQWTFLNTGLCWRWGILQLLLSLGGLVLSGCGFPMPDDAAWQSMGLVFRPQSRREYQCYFLNTGAAGGAME